MFGMETTLRDGVLRAIATNFRPKLRAGVNRLGTRARKLAQDRARVRTGEMRSKIVAQIVDGGDTVELHLIGQAKHTIYNELGTRYMSAQPMLGPAMDEIRPDLEDLVAEAFTP